MSIHRYICNFLLVKSLFSKITKRKSEHIHFLISLLLYIIVALNFNHFVAVFDAEVYVRVVKYIKIILKTIETNIRNSTKQRETFENFTCTYNLQNYIN